MVCINWGGMERDAAVLNATVVAFVPQAGLNAADAVSEPRVQDIRMRIESKQNIGRRISDDGDTST